MDFFVVDFCVTGDVFSSGFFVLVNLLVFGTGVVVVVVVVVEVDGLLVLVVVATVLEGSTHVSQHCSSVLAL